MSDETSVRLKLPLIQPGQAQKELSHNEALALLDLLAQPSVTAAGLNAAPETPAAGECWIVGSAPTGAWAGHAGCLAGWCAGGWRFAAPFEGMSAWVAEVQQIARFSQGAWTIGEIAGTALRIGGMQVVGPQGAAIGAADGGVVVDSEARAAIEAILTALRTHGLIAT